MARKSHPGRNDPRTVALSHARMAVRRYARNPSDANARVVETAVRNIRALSRIPPVMAVPRRRDGAPD